VTAVLTVACASKPLTPSNMALLAHCTVPSRSIRAGQSPVTLFCSQTPPCIKAQKQLNHCDRTQYCILDMCACASESIFQRTVLSDA